jgi:hypothetical protein
MIYSYIDKWGKLAKMGVTPFTLRASKNLPQDAPPFTAPKLHGIIIWPAK